MTQRNLQLLTVNVGRAPSGCKTAKWARGVSLGDPHLVLEGGGGRRCDNLSLHRSPYTELTQNDKTLNTHCPLPSPPHTSEGGCCRSSVVGGERLKDTERV